jgi:hypothetical protein
MQNALENESRVAHVHRMNIIKEALLIKTINAINDDEPLEKTKKLIKLLDSSTSVE